MFLFGGTKQSPQRTRGPAILSSADGAMPTVQIVSSTSFNTVPRKKGLARRETVTESRLHLQHRDSIVFASRLNRILSEGFASGIHHFRWLIH
ncbi:hypothetical protein ABMA27_000097 [Loxostege sticticalis]|uniref:Uncharacterized protein n=1 Tax=Loxostege sticticalis TaxID=481309 RepID=A0ABR3IM38_LOXSC